MKKLFFLSLIFSVPMAQAATTYTGFYGNLGVGGTIMDVQVKESVAISDPGIVDVSFPSKINMEGRGFSPRVGAGYSYQFQNHFVLNAEVTAELDNADVTHRNVMLIFANTIESKVTTELKNDFALLFKPGYVFHQYTQIYALIGPRWGNFVTTLTTTIVDSNGMTKSSDYKVGVTAGVGLEHLITERLSLGFEYAYTNYGQIQSLQNTFDTNIDVGVPIVAQVTDEADFDVTSNSFVFQLNYYF